MDYERVPRPIPWFLDEGSGMIFMDTGEDWLDAAHNTPLFEQVAVAHNSKIITGKLGWMPF